MAWWLTLYFAILITAGVRLTVPAESFADFATYVDVARDIAGSNFLSLWPLEPLSRGTLLLGWHITGNAESAALAVHWVNSLVFVAGLALVTAKYRSDWHGLLVVWGLYGALLGFVTLRATPAYLLAAYAVTRLADRPLRGALVLTLAAGFHASALLMLGPWLCNALVSKEPRRCAAGRVVWPGQRWRLLWVVVAVACYAAVSGGLGEVDALVKLLSSNEVTAKFAIYAEFAAAGENLQSASHRAYFALLSLLAFLGAMTRHGPTMRMWPFVASAFFLTALTAASPVVSFRLSLFWTIPLLLSFPWARWMRSDLRFSGLAAAALVLYVLGLRGVMAN